MTVSQSPWFPRYEIGTGRFVTDSQCSIDTLTIDVGAHRSAEDYGNDAKGLKMPIFAFEPQLDFFQDLQGRPCQYNFPFAVSGENGTYK